MKDEITEKVSDKDALYKKEVEKLMSVVDNMHVASGRFITTDDAVKILKLLSPTVLNNAYNKLKKPRGRRGCSKRKIKKKKCLKKNKVE